MVLSCILTALLTSPGRAIDRLPLEDFARDLEMSEASLSPDGKSLAYLSVQGARTMILVDSLDKKEGWRIDPGIALFANEARKQVDAYAWVSNRRLLISTSVWDMHYGVVATDVNARNSVGVSGYETLRVGSLRGPANFVRDVLSRTFEPEPVILMIDRHDRYGGGAEHPDVLRLNADTGSLRVVAKNPGEVVSWVPDNHGVVRAGVTSHGALSSVLYRETDDSAWREIYKTNERSARLRPLGYDAATGQFIFAALSSGRRWVPVRLDPATGKISEPLLDDPEHDIFNPRGAPKVDGILLDQPLFAGGAEGLLGFRYCTDAPRVKWFSAVYADAQRRIDRALPNTVNIPVQISLDGNRVLWFAYSDQDPGTYLLTDLAKKTLRPLGKRMSWIKPAQMAPMLAITYKARDGVVIHGYITVPVGHQPKNLPLVVLPHGGPWVRDVWEFDPLIQLLANRGYAVLQMNFRGSPGYGQDLLDLAQREIGGKIQDDIEDATRWAIGAGVADPKRIAIYGGSYGGYSALFALGKNPELYRCGISYAGVSDWLDIFDRRKNDPDYKRANAFWREQIGDPEKNAEQLRLASPVTFAESIAAPVLVIQGKEDRIVPPQQATLMIEALTRAGRKPESLFLPRVGHEYGDAASRKLIYEHIVGFLEKNLGPGVE